MNGLERVRTVLKRGVPDRVPRALYDVAIGTYNESTLELFQERMGRHPRDCFEHDVRAVDITPSHLINADIPWENIVAFFEAAEAYGGYG